MEIIVHLDMVLFFMASYRNMRLKTAKSTKKGNLLLKWRTWSKKIAGFSTNWYPETDKVCSQIPFPVFIFMDFRHDFQFYTYLFTSYVQALWFSLISFQLKDLIICT